MKLQFASFLTALLCCATALAQPAPAPQQWGTILGRIIYDGKAPEARVLPAKPGVGPIPDESLIVGKNSGLANVFVYLRTNPAARILIHPGYLNAPPRKLTITARNYRYEPHATILWNKDELEFSNADRVGHNLNYSSVVHGWSDLVAPGQRVIKNMIPAERLPKMIGCNIHPWMNAQLLVLDTPYFCVTDERGIFCIPNLPQGQPLEFQFWHERVGFLRNLPSENQPLNTDNRGRLQINLTQPVTDFGEFRVDPREFK
jgi:hypothetical protein